MSLRQRIRWALEELGVRLGRRVLPGAHAAADAAAEVDTIDLAAIWRDPEIAAAWDAAERRVAPLGLTAQGGMNPGDRRALYYLVRHLRPERVLEVGTLAGASTVHLAVGLADAWPGPVLRRLLTVDIADVNDPERGAWRRLGLAQSPRQAMERLGFGGMVEFGWPLPSTFWRNPASRSTSSCWTVTTGSRPSWPRFPPRSVGSGRVACCCCTTTSPGFEPSGPMAR